jgi:amidase
MHRTLLETIDALKNGTATPAGLTDQARSLLRDHSDRGIGLAAVIENPAEPGDPPAGARGETPHSPADATDAPLAGAPVALKDNIDTVGLGCSAGSLALQEIPVRQDAFIVSRLREAGASIPFKTNLSEWANFRSTRSMSGWSSAGGQCRNPFVLDRSPCGSSSGSAVAVAAGYVSAAIGTETDGSIICPAATNGVVGIKPTMGRVSRSGIVPIGASQDTAGPMARTVEDAALLLQCIQGEDPDDPVTADALRDTSPDLFSDLGMKNLKGMRLGYFEGGEGFLAAVKSEFHKALNYFEEAGAELLNIGSLAFMDELHCAEFQVLLCEFRDDIIGYFRRFRPNNRFVSLNDLIVYNMDRRDLVMPYFGQELFYQASETRGRTDRSYAPALETCRRLAGGDGLELMFKEYRLDALLMPSNNPAWLVDPVLGDYGTGGSSTLAAVSGWPSITVPMARLFGLPVGLSIVGRPWMESRIIGLGGFFENYSRNLPPAAFLPTLGFDHARRYDSGSSSRSLTGP